MSLTESDTYNGPDPAGRSQPAPAVPVALRMSGWGVSIGLDDSSATGYVPDNVDGTVSMFALNR